MVNGVVPVLVAVVTGLDIVALLNPVDGVHAYVYPNVDGAPRVALCPEQYVVASPAFATGTGPVTTLTVSAETHPANDVVTMY